MQKNKLNLHIYGIHLLNPYKTVVSHLKSHHCLCFRHFWRYSTWLTLLDNLITIVKVVLVYPLTANQLTEGYGLRLGMSRDQNPSGTNTQTVVIADEKASHFQLRLQVVILQAVTLQARFSSLNENRFVCKTREKALRHL